ncbi:MAG TPA: MEDS domain-containing protein, partial [Candidatus Limnocylindrales bacterium]
GTLARHLSQERNYSQAVLEGRLVFHDAEAMLGRVMVAGTPSSERFADVVGEALRGVQDRAGHTGVRAYGEMVGLLWKAGELDAAVRLEELWNELLRVHDVSLFCGYPIDIFSPDFQADKVDALLCAHTHLLPLNPALENALNRAMDEVLGPRVDGLRRLIQANHRPAWAKIPPAEALVLWLRNNLPGSAEQIINLARRYYQPQA